MTLSDAVAAEIRGRLARIPHKERPTAATIGTALTNLQGAPRSQNYVSVRLRGEAAFSIDEVEKIAGLLGVAPEEIFDAATRTLEGGGLVVDPPRVER